MQHIGFLTVTLPSGKCIYFKHVTHIDVNEWYTRIEKDEDIQFVLLHLKITRPEPGSNSQCFTGHQGEEFSLVSSDTF